MAPENRGDHVNPSEAVACASATSGRLRGSGLALANLSTAAGLFLRAGWLRARRRSLHSNRRRSCQLPSGTPSISHTGLKQLGNCCLIGIEQFVCPRQTFKSFA